jgi:aspartate aminotransferase
MRVALRKKLEELSGKDWSHVTTQIGMFCYSGLSAEQVCYGFDSASFTFNYGVYQVKRLREEFAIYCTEDGRFSMAGINTGNIEYLAKSVAAVSK